MSENAEKWLRRQPEVEEPPLAQYFLVSHLPVPGTGGKNRLSRQVRIRGQISGKEDVMHALRPSVLIWSNIKTHFLKLKPFGYFIVVIFLEENKKNLS